MDRFDPFAADYLPDPYPQLARVRVDPGLLRPDLDMWVVSRNADIEAVFSDQETFSAAHRPGPGVPGLPDEARTTLPEGFPRCR